MGGKVSGACTRGTHGRAVLARMAKRAAAGGSDALLGPALGKQGSRVEEGERRERERELTLIFLKIFNGSSKKFEYESCSKFKFLQLSFQAKLRLSNDLKVKNLNSSLMNPLFLGVFSKFHVVT